MMQGAIAFDTSKLNGQRLVMQIAVYLLAGLLGLTILAWLAAFVVTIAFHLLLIACEHASHLDILTQVLLIIVLGFLLKVVVQYCVCGLRSLFSRQ